MLTECWWNQLNLSYRSHLKLLDFEIDINMDILSYSTIASHELCMGTHWQSL